MTSSPCKFGVTELTRLTGCSTAVAELTFARLDPPVLYYRPLDSAATRAAMAGIRDAIWTKSLRVVGADDPAVWERGWAELAETLAGQRITTHSLRPQYFHADVPCRLFGGLVEQVTPDFEYWVGLCVRFATFAEFLAERDRVIEFGCGTGINLLLLTMLRSGARLTGCDWSTPSQVILAQMARETGQAIEGHRFNMLTATGDCGAIDQSSAVLTVHALEQLGTGWQPLLDLLLAHRPGLCLHIEPLVELYDPAVPLDDLAIQYHRKRRYLEGFVPAIQRLAGQGRAEILALRRTAYAGLYQEAYSVLAWRLL